MRFTVWRPKVDKEWLIVKRIQRIPALLLAMAMLCSLTLTGCKKEEPPVAADKVAVAIFDLILKDDASSSIELFGYADEAEARKDMGLEDGLFDVMADEVVSQFSGMGLNVSDEDAQAFVDAFTTMFKNVEMTAVVKESDEKAGTAVVTCSISTFDANAMADATAAAMTELMSDPAIVQGDMDAAGSVIINAMSKAISELTPTGDKADFDVDFELETVEINGKERKAWLPADEEEFGMLISTTALGG